MKMSVAEMQRTVKRKFQVQPSLEVQQNRNTDSAYVFVREFCCECRWQGVSLVIIHSSLLLENMEK